MTNTFRRLTRACAAATTLFYFSAFVIPAGLWANTSSKNSKEKNQHKSLEGKDYPKLVIGVGDLLDIEVYGENGGMMGQSSDLVLPSSNLPTDYQVDSEGVIVYPFIGKIKLAGLTPAEASELLAKKLHKPRKVTVLIKESDTYWVSVIGDVGHPGRYPIVGHPTLLSSLALSGGPMPDADMGGAILIHQNFKTKIDLNQYLTGDGAMKPEPYIYPGDTLMVPKSGWPSITEIAIIASILASVTVITIDLTKK